MSERIIAVDWGTTNRRIFVIADGIMVSREQDERGAARVSDFAREIADIRARLGDLPVMLAGMVGSNIGWHATPYVAAPAGIADLAAAIVRRDARTFIVPGVSLRAGARCDVMRGEEVQLLGAAAAGMVPRDALLCQPGTHCKWAELTDGRIVSFTTAMTGELFALLRTHGLLAPQLCGPVEDGDAFRDGVRAGARGDLAASLFGIRAAGLLGARDDRDAPAYASGLLIGADVAARLAERPGGTVHLLADPVLGALYTSAITLLGGNAIRHDSEAAFVAGIGSIWEQLA